MSWLVSCFRSVLQLKNQNCIAVYMHCIAFIKIKLTLTEGLGTRTYYAVFSQLDKKLYLQFCKQAQTSKKYSL